MGPHFFKCGKFGLEIRATAAKEASMGPHFFKCGKLIARPASAPAGLFASMGPHFFKCGKCSCFQSCIIS